MPDKLKQQGVEASLKAEKNSEEKSLKRDTYIKSVVEQIRCKKARDYVAEELRQHIDDQAEAFISKGDAIDEAERKAVIEMGDPINAGRDFDQVHRPKPNWTIISATLLLVIGGGIVQGFLGWLALTANGEQGSLWNEQLIHHLTILPIGVASFLFVYFLDYTFFIKHSRIFYGVLLLVMVLILMYSPIIGGRNLYMYQMSLLAAPVYAGLVYSFRGRGYMGIIISAVLSLPAAVLILSAPTAMGMTLFMISVFAVLTAAGVKEWFGLPRKKSLGFIFGSTGALCLLLLLYMSISSNLYRVAERLSNFFVVQDPLGMGYRLSSLRMVLSGRESGIADWDLHYLGLLNSREAFETALLTERFGLLAFALIALAGIGFALCLFYTALKQKSVMGFMTCFSCAMIISLQITFHLLQNAGIMLMGDVAFPLISYGGAVFTANMILIGLFLSAAKYDGILRDGMAPEIGKAERQLGKAVYLALDRGAKALNRYNEI